MEYLDMKIKLNKNKSIGNVLFIVEGSKTEPYLIKTIFTKIFDYDYQEHIRTTGNKIAYHQYNSKVNSTSKIFVINSEESNIKYISRDNDYLNNLFIKLISDYHFNVDNSAIYYIFDRDVQSNTDKTFIENMINTLKNSRDNEGYNRQGLLLLSYPSIESFTLSNFIDNSFNLEFNLGKNIKTYLFNNRINQCNINDITIIHAANEMVKALIDITKQKLDIDNIGITNKQIFDYEENSYNSNGLYKSLSLLCIAFLDLGLFDVQ